jgi:hypothetical protein
LLQQVGAFSFDLGNDPASPPTPILFSEPRIGSNRGLEVFIYYRGGLNGSTGITHPNTIPCKPTQSAPPIIGILSALIRKRRVALPLNSILSIPAGLGMPHKAEPCDFTVFHHLKTLEIIKREKIADFETSIKKPKSSPP